MTAQKPARIGERLRRLREAQGVGVNELGRKAGIKGPTVSRIETGEIRSPTRNTALKLARALGVSVDALWQGTELGAEPISMAGEAPSIDVELLAHILEGLDLELHDLGLQIPPRRRAQLAAIFYAHFALRGVIERNEFAKILQLVLDK
jgi:transcriptional regulator with XRE-family HTH domain